MVHWWCKIRWSVTSVQLNQFPSIPLITKNFVCILSTLWKFHHWLDHLMIKEFDGPPFLILSLIKICQLNLSVILHFRVFPPLYGLSNHTCWKSMMLFQGISTMERLKKCTCRTQLCWLQYDHLSREFSFQKVHLALDLVKPRVGNLYPWFISQCGFNGYRILKFENHTLIPLFLSHLKLQGSGKSVILQNIGFCVI